MLIKLNQLSRLKSGLFWRQQLAMLEKGLFWRQHLSWLQSGLFWRTFFLLAFMIVASMAVWIASYRVVERTPRAHQVAARIVSIVTITRSALMHSAPDLQRELLFDLASNEGIRVYSREPSDQIQRPSSSDLMSVIAQLVREGLGEKTEFADSVNDLKGFWVSFNIQDDQYWLMLDRNRVESTAGVQWIGWASATLFLSLVGGVFISRLINLPLSRLSATARAIAEGKPFRPLPDEGPIEIRETNRNFNQMVQDLERLEADRNVILAGISHDLRTPISRMLLEVEMADLDPEARRGMQTDLAQMDAIIAQFLDFAKPGDTSKFQPVDLSELIADAAQQATRLPDVLIRTSIAAGLHVVGNATDLKRVINNMIENARRYGRTPGAASAEIDIDFYAEDGNAVIRFADHGTGIPDSDIPHLLKPFTRMDSARSQANGAGLGLAIMDRMIQRHGGKLRLSNRCGGGLQIEITLPLIYVEQAATTGKKPEPEKARQFG